MPSVHTGIMLTFTNLSVKQPRHSIKIESFTGNKRKMRVSKRRIGFFVRSNVVFFRIDFQVSVCKISQPNFRAFPVLQKQILEPISWTDSTTISSNVPFNYLSNFIIS